MYVDTADLRLTRAKRTLRRRAGGRTGLAPRPRRCMEYGADLSGSGGEAPMPSTVSRNRCWRGALDREHPLGPIARVDNVRHVSV